MEKFRSWGCHIELALNPADFNRANLNVNQGASIVARCVKVGKVNFCLIPRTLGWIPFVRSHRGATATHTLRRYLSL